MRIITHSIAATVRHGDLRSRALHMIKNLTRDTGGTVAVLFGICFIALALGGGVAVDFVRGSRQQMALASAVDAAALAAAVSKITDEAELEQLVHEYIEQNFTNKYPGLSFDVDVVVGENTVQVTAHQQMETTIMRIAQIDTMDLGATAEVTRGGKGAEVVLVLDNTGSMLTNDKIGDLKTAVADLTEVLFGDNATSEFLKIGIVPFSTTVNIGPQYTDVTWLDHTGLNPISKLNFTDTTKHNRWAWDQLSNRDWNGCVEQRQVANGIDYDVDDTPPSIATPATLFPLYFAPDEPTNANNASSKTGWGSGFVNSYLADWKSSESVSNSTKNNTSLIDRQRRHQKYMSVSISGDGPAYNCGIAPLTPLTNVKQTVLDAIDDMIADGNTNIASGVGWGLRVLSSTEPFTEGVDYDDENWRKIMIVMTDGENVWGDRNNMNKSMYGGYGYISQSAPRLNIANVTNSRSVYDTRTAKACDVVKSATGDPDNPIVVYTITFGSLDDTAKTLMENCATDSEKYYHAPDGATIQTVFQNIAEEINKVYLSK
jgi:Flp pilus assembly protein TadG